jgi:hypothetical protein
MRESPQSLTESLRECVRENWATSFSAASIFSNDSDSWPNCFPRAMMSFTEALKTPTTWTEIGLEAAAALATPRPRVTYCAAVPWVCLSWRRTQDLATGSLSSATRVSTILNMLSGDLSLHWLCPPGSELWVLRCAVHAMNRHGLAFPRSAGKSW